MAADIELKLLNLLCNKEFYNAHYENISTKILSTEVKSLLKVITKLHKLTENNVYLFDIIDMYENSTTITTAKLNLVKQIVYKIDDLPSISEEVALEILEKLNEKEAARKIADMALSIMQREEDAGTLLELKDFINNLSFNETVIDTDEPYTTDIIEILKNKESKGLFEFKNGLEFLANGTGKLSRGHFVIVFASTNAGKSSFVAQASGGFINDGYKVLYICNEEPAYHIMLNQIRALEKKSDIEIANKPETKEWDKVKSNFILIPAHGKTLTELMASIKKHKPDIIIFDQLDNIPGMNTRDKLHETLERTYQQARALAGSTDSLVFAVSQASDDATGKVILRSQMLANSKVGKAGTADLIIGIGMKNVEDSKRSITLCKNKIKGIHETYHCILNHEIARYEL